MQDHLQDDRTAKFGGDLVDALAAQEDFLAGGVVVPFQEGIEGQDDVDFIGTFPDGLLDLGQLHLDEALRGREAARDGGHVQLRVLAGLPDDGGEVRIDAHRGRQRIIGIIDGEGIDLLHELTHRGRGVLGAQGGEVHDGEALLQDFVGNNLVQAGRNQFQMMGDRLLIRGIAILGE